MPTHVEFLNRSHFENHLKRRQPNTSLGLFIDYFWETEFESLSEKYPQGFSDLLFPNVGYTYFINLGTPSTWNYDKHSLTIKSEAFLPRNKQVMVEQDATTHIFGIKFLVSPILFEKEVDFSEYADFIYPLSYLIDQSVIKNIRTAKSFNERIDIASKYYSGIIKKVHSSGKPAMLVAKIIRELRSGENNHLPIHEAAAKYGTSAENLQRYFRESTGLSYESTLELLRIRNATEALSASPSGFDYLKYGYESLKEFSKKLENFIGSEYATELMKEHRGKKKI